MRFLQREFSKRLAETVTGSSDYHLLTDGSTLRLLLCDPARPDSHIAIALSGALGWRMQNLAPDSYRMLLAVARPR